MKKILMLFSLIMLTIGGTIPFVEGINKNFNQTNKQYNDVNSTKFYNKTYFSHLYNNLAFNVKNNSIILDSDILNNDIWQKDIYNLMLSSDYYNNLEIKDQWQMIFMNDEGNIFSEENSKYYAYQGIWVEWYPSWFLYWRLHIGHRECRDFVNLMDNNFGEFVSLVAGILVAAGGVGVIVAPVIAGFLYANSFIFDKWDKGNGVWIGIHGIIPNLEWGSD